MTALAALSPEALRDIIADQEREIDELEQAVVMLWRWYVSSGFARIAPRHAVIPAREPRPQVDA